MGSGGTCHYCHKWDCVCDLQAENRRLKEKLRLAMKENEKLKKDLELAGK